MQDYLCSVSGEADEEEEEGGQGDAADVPPHRNGAASAAAANGSSNPARASFWEVRPASPETPAAGTVVSFDGAGVEAEAAVPEPPHSPEEATLPLIKDGLLGKVEKIGGKLFFGVEMPVETSNSRYFRLQPDSLEYYKSKGAADAGGVESAKGVFSFGDVLTARPGTIEPEPEPSAASSLLSSLPGPLAGLYGPLAGITGGASAPVDDKCGLEVVMQPWYRNPNRVYVCTNAVCFVYTCRRWMDLSLIAGTSYGRPTRPSAWRGSAPSPARSSSTLGSVPGRTATPAARPDSLRSYRMRLSSVARPQSPWPQSSRRSSGAFLCNK